MKVLLVSFYFPPAGGGGVQRPLKLAQYLPTMGIETHVLAPDDPRWLHRDEGLRMPSQAWVHRARYVGVSGGKPSEVLAGTQGLERAVTHARLQLRRLRRIVEPHDMIDVGRDDIAVRGGTGDRRQARQHVGHRQPIEPHADERHALSRHRHRGTRP